MNGTVADTACPECEQGKHHNCDERSLDRESDTIGACPCFLIGHPDEAEQARIRDELTARLRVLEDDALRHLSAVDGDALAAEPPEDVVDAEVVEEPESRKTRAQRLLLQAAVLKSLTALNEEARKVAAAEYTAKDREGATYRGVPLGNVRMDEGRVTVRVADPEAALAWAEVNFPEQINAVTVPTVTDEGLAWLRENRPEWVTQVTAYREVYPAFLKSLTEGVKRAKGGWVKRGTPPEPLPWVDPETGEERADRPPWISYHVSDPILVVTPSEEALEQAASLVSATLPALGSGL